MNPPPPPPPAVDSSPGSQTTLQGRSSDSRRFSLKRQAPGGPSTSHASQHPSQDLSSSSLQSPGSSPKPAVSAYGSLKRQPPPGSSNKHSTPAKKHEARPEKHAPHKTSTQHGRAASNADPHASKAARPVKAEHRPHAEHRQRSEAAPKSPDAPAKDAAPKQERGAPPANGAGPSPSSRSAQSPSKAPSSAPSKAAATSSPSKPAGASTPSKAPAAPSPSTAGAESSPGNAGATPSPSKASPAKRQRPAGPTAAQVKAAEKRAQRLSSVSDGSSNLVLSEADIAAALSRLGDYITECGGDFDPEGWSVKVSVRKSGNTAGTTDHYYYDPRGTKYRSHKEVAKKYFQLEPVDKRRSTGPAKAKKSVRELADAAVKLAESNRLSLPITAQHNVVVKQLGKLPDVAEDGTQRFCTSDLLYPDGYEAHWTDDAKTCTFVSTISVSEHEGHQPFFAVHLQRSAKDGEEPPSPTRVAASHQGPDQVWTRVFKRAGRAQALDADAASSATLSNADQAALVLKGMPLPPVEWGRMLYGLTDIGVLQMLEALPGVAEAAAVKDTPYVMAEARAKGGWLREQQVLSNKLRGFEQEARAKGRLPDSPQGSGPSRSGKRRLEPAVAPTPAKLPKLIVPTGKNKEEQKYIDGTYKAMEALLSKVEKAVINEERRKELSERRSQQMKRQHEARRKEEQLLEDTTLPGASETPPGAAPLRCTTRPEAVSMLLQVWEFLESNAGLFGLQNLPSLYELEEALNEKGDDAAFERFESTVVPLVRLLVLDIYTVASAEYIEEKGDVEQQERDLKAGTPLIDGDTWQHAASGILAGCALGLYLPRGFPDAVAPYRTNGNWPGLQGQLDPILWLGYVTGTFTNSPALRPVIVFLSQAAARTSLESALHVQSAQAMQAAEAFCAAARRGGSPDAAGVAAAARLLESVYEKLPKALRPLVLLKGEDVSLAARTGRPVDLYSIVAALDAGVHAATGQARNAAEEDLRELIGVLRAAAQRVVVPLDASFESAGERIADDLEAALEAALHALGANGNAPMEVERSGGADAAAAEEPDGEVDTLAAVKAQLKPFQEPEEVRHVSQSAATQAENGVSGLRDSSCIVRQLFGLEAVAARLAKTEARQLTPMQRLELLNALVVLCADTNAAREAMKVQTQTRDALTHERAELRKAIRAAEKDAREAQKKGGKAAAASGSDAARRTMSTRTTGGESDPEADAERLIEVEASLLTVSMRIAPHLGQDRHRNDYWCVPDCTRAVSSQQGHQPTFCVLSQRYSEAPGGNAAPDTEAKTLLFMDGVESSQPDVQRGRWVVYRTASDVQPLLAWLHKKGLREGPLRTRVLSAVETMRVLEGQSAAGDDGPAPKPASTSERTRELSTPHGRRLAVFLLRILQSVPESAMLTVRGGEARRAALRAALARAGGLPPCAEDSDADLSGIERGDLTDQASRSDPPGTPAELMAGLLMIEAMVAVPWLRPFWRLWSFPLPLPDATATWSAVWLRAKMFRSALREGRGAPSKKELAQFERNSTPDAAPHTRRNAAAGLDLSVIDQSEGSRRTRGARINYADQLGNWRGDGEEEGGGGAASQEGSPEPRRNAAEARAARYAARHEDFEPEPRRPARAAAPRRQVLDDSSDDDFMELIEEEEEEESDSADEDAD